MRKEEDCLLTTYKIHRANFKRSSDQFGRPKEAVDKWRLGRVEIEERLWLVFGVVS